MGHTAAEQDIIKLIETETAAYLAKDFEAWADCWMHTDYVSRTGWMQMVGTIQHLGWDENAQVMKDAMVQYDDPVLHHTRRENWKIIVRAGMAWASFDQINEPSGDPFDSGCLQHESRILERYDGQWKIINVGVLRPTAQHAECPLIQVTESGKVVWMNALAKSAIKTQPGLTISGGNLHASSRSADELLHLAIKEAERLNDFFNKSASLPDISPHNSAIPVLLGEDEDAGLMICWVSGDSKMILVSFDDKETMANRLEKANSIYSLSPGQMRLAALIVEGKDLGQAAEQLDISVNTARTHLQRMFDKTGVRSQPALVRVLLSVAAPDS